MNAVLSIGEQLARQRSLAEMTQEQLAEQSGVSVDVIRKLEQGNRSTARLATLKQLANALGAELSVLITPRQTLAPVDAARGGGIEAIRNAVTVSGLDALADMADRPEAPELERLGASAAETWRIWQAGDYSALATTLPVLLAEARYATRDLSGDDQVAAYGHLATAYETAAGVAVMLGYEDLAWLAAERALAAGERSGDPVVMASTRHWAAWILRRQGRYRECVRVATRAAEDHEPSMMRATGAQLAVWGGLLVNASGAAARDDKPNQADELLSVARAAGGRLSTNRVDRWSVFGPRLVEQTAVTNATETGDYERAVMLAERVEHTADQLPPSWEARYLLGLAAAYAELGRDVEALTALTRARQVAPEWVRYYRLARDVTLTLAERAGRRHSDPLDAMLRHLHLAV